MGPTTTQTIAVGHLDFYNTPPTDAVKLHLMPRFFPLALLCLSLAGCAPAQNAPAQNATAPTAPVAARAVPAQPTERARLQDKSIAELSGLAASRRYPGVLWGHNDSGDTARLFALNERGETVATVNFAGLEARDWEDMTLAGQWIYIAEIGDNLSINENIRVYRLREPDLNPDKTGQIVDLKPAQWEEMTLSYPDGARDAETLAATPDGHLLIVSKNRGGSNFYALKEPFQNGRTATLDKIFFDVQFGATGWTTKLATSGDLSPDGKTLAVTTYTQLYQFPLARPFDFTSLQIRAPQIQELPRLKQCESVCFAADGRSLWVASEGKGAPLWELPLSGDEGDGKQGRQGRQGRQEE